MDKHNKHHKNKGKSAEKPSISAEIPASIPEPVGAKPKAGTNTGGKSKSGVETKRAD